MDRFSFSVPMSELVQTTVHKPISHTGLPRKSLVLMWLAILLVAYLVSVFARVEYRIYVQGRQDERTLSEAKPKLIDYVKSTMFKPTSFEFKSIRYRSPTDTSPYYEFGMQYLANNILGEAIPNYIEVRTDANGNIIEVIRE
jgi:hypothetical protein